MTGLIIFAVVVVSAAIIVLYKDTDTMSTEEIIQQYTQKPTQEFIELLKTETKYKELYAAVKDKDIEEQNLVLNAYVHKRYDEINYQLFLDKPINSVITESDQEHYENWKKA